MGRFDTTKATINANIKSNGNQEITGSVLNSVLQEMVDGTDAQLTELSAEINGAESVEFAAEVGASTAVGYSVFQQLVKGKKYRFKSTTRCNLEYYTDNGGYKHLFDEQNDIEFICPSDYEPTRAQNFVNNESVKAQFEILLYEKGIYSELSDIDASIKDIHSNISDITTNISKLSDDVLKNVETINSLENRIGDGVEIVENVFSVRNVAGGSVTSLAPFINRAIIGRVYKFVTSENGGSIEGNSTALGSSNYKHLADNLKSDIPFFFVYEGFNTLNYYSKTSGKYDVDIYEVEYPLNSLYSNASNTEVFRNGIDELYEALGGSLDNYFDDKYSGSDTENGIVLNYVEGFANGYAIDADGKIVYDAAYKLSYRIPIRNMKMLYIYAGFPQTRTFANINCYDSEGELLCSLFDTSFFIPFNKVSYVRIVINAAFPMLTVSNNSEVQEYDEIGGFKKLMTYDKAIEESVLLRNKNFHIDMDVDLYKASNNAIQMSNISSLQSIWDYINRMNPRTIIDSGKCGKTLYWVLYSDGELEISGSGSSYDFIKGVMIGKNKAEIESYVRDYPNMDYYGFREGSDNYYEEKKVIEGDGSTRVFNLGERLDVCNYVKKENGEYVDSSEYSYNKLNGTITFNSAPSDGEKVEIELAQYVSPWYRYRDEREWGVYDELDHYLISNPNHYVYNRITIHHGITYVGDWMFYRVCGATKIEFPDSVIEMGIWCVRYSTTLNYVKLSKELREIGWYGISRNEQLVYIDFNGNDKLQKVGACAFQANPMLERLDLPMSATILVEEYTEGGVFHNTSAWLYGCDSLRYIDMGSITITKNELYNMPYNCPNLQKIKMSDNVMLIPTQSFVGCISLESIVIPKNCASIGASAFYGCNNLTTIYVDSPSFAKDIYIGDAFKSCKNLYIKDTITDINFSTLYVFEKVMNIGGYDWYTKKQ